MTKDVRSLGELRADLRALNAEAVERGVEVVFGTLESGGLSDAQILKLERAFGCVLPESFKHIVQHYDVSRLEIADTVFSEETYFDELLWLNCETTWWCGSPFAFPEAPRTTARPAHLLMIAQGDPFSWLLDLTDGRILGLDVEKLYPDAVHAAHDVEQFIRCRATLWLAGLRSQPLEELRAEILRITDGDARAWSF